MPVFIIMFQVLKGLTRLGVDNTFDPKYISENTDLFRSLDKTNEMLSFGLNLALTPAEAMGENFVKGLPYALLIIVLGGLFFVQQRMIASRTVSPTMSPTQAKIMQYLPVAFAVFQVFLPTSLVAYYMVQAIFRIVQQSYITRRFYGENGLGREAQEASARAREISKDDAGSAKKDKQKSEPAQAAQPIQSKRVTPSKNRPTPSSRPARPVPPSKRNKG
jgi:YidC/Oxa1 family membrane protein insertase